MYNQRKNSQCFLQMYLQAFINTTESRFDLLEGQEVDHNSVRVESAKQRQRRGPTNVARVRFPDSASYVG